MNIKTANCSLYSGFVWTLILTVIVLLSKRSKPEIVHYDGNANFSNISISSELISIPGRLGLLWTSTRDRVLRKYNLPLNNYHRYGLQFNVNNNYSQFFLFILLAGDVATNPGPSKPVKCVSLNACSLKSLHNTDGKVISNIHCFQDLVYAHELDIICVNETWLNKNILNCELLNDDYVIFRKDRESRRAGGVLIAIRANSFTNVQQYIHETNQDEELEIVAAVVVTSQQQKVLICSCYRPPDSTSNWIDTFNTYLSRACDLFDNVVICGDFNLPDISWDNTIANKTNGHPFIEVLNDHFLTQVNNFPTRGDNILDLQITSVPEHVTITQIETPENAAVFTDHSVVFYELNAFVTIQAKTRRYVYDYGKGDFEGLRSRPRTCVQI